MQIREIIRVLKCAQVSDKCERDFVFCHPLAVTPEEFKEWYPKYLSNVTTEEKKSQRKENEIKINVQALHREEMK